MNTSFPVLLVLTALSVSLLIGQVVSLACPQGRWQCSSVGDYNYVTCNNQATCECLSDQGFIGTAQVNDTCRCDQQIIWQAGLAYCINVKQSALLKKQIGSLDPNGDMAQRLDWFAGGSYTISGGFQFISENSAPGYNTQTKLAIDVQNEMIYFNHVNNIHWMWPTISQTVNGFAFASAFVVAGRCYLSNYTAKHQRSFHQSDVFIGNTINHQRLTVRQYVGKSFDHHTAELSLAGDVKGRIGTYTEQTNDGIIVSWTWDHPFDIFGGLARRIAQSAVFDYNTLIRGTPDPTFWNLPELCRTPGKVYWFSELPVSLATQRPLF